MRNIFLLFSFLLLFSGCNRHEENQQQAETPVTKASSEAVPSEIKKEEHNTTLNRVGIHKEGDIITIDTNKTRHFLQSLGEKITEQAARFANEMQEGIEANESYIRIDLNKTDSLLDKWQQKMQNFANEINTLSTSLEENDTQEQTQE